MELSPLEMRKREGAGKVTYRCRCCGDAYVRGQFKCCAPQSGMASHRWLELACKKLEDGGCGKCFRHCTCPDKNLRLGKGPLADEARRMYQRIVDTSQGHSQK